MPQIVHSGLFLKLMDRNVPKSFLDILMTWHDGLMCRVKWDNVFSDWFAISAGVRQGGVLSPDLYGIYVDELIVILQKANIGCYFRDKFAASLFYADDMAVLAPSIKGLQRLIDLCNEYCSEWDILLNAKKTKNLFFGKGPKPTYSILLNKSAIPWVDQWPYLGIMVKSGLKFDCCVKDKISSFYRALNAIIRIDGNADELVRLRLLESHCLPILTYGIEILHVSNRDERRQLRVAYNSIFRNIFKFTYHESVTELQHALGRCTWEELLTKRQEKFLTSCTMCIDSPLIRSLALLVV